MLTSQEISILGNILNSTFGKSSTVKSPTVSIKGSLSGNNLELKYTTIIHLASERNLRDQVKKFEEESIKLLSDYIKMCKKEFKGGSGRTLKLKEIGSNDSVEVITTSPYAPRKTAYYRRFTTLSCE
mgnify:CR=1 FL=1|jgi:hypothetical protein|tara:strand:+ start:1799 stop:2179 length:381 start_codon:yes stop_codon:yes gene_type:complete